MSKSVLFYRYIDRLYLSVPIGVYEGLILVFSLGAFLLLTLNGVKKGLKPVLWLLTGEYAFLVLCSTLFFRPLRENSGYNFTPFWSYVAFLNGWSCMLNEILMNVVVFVPLGFLLGCCSQRLNWKLVMIIGLGMSLLIELLQFSLMRGFSEFDDVFNNVLGCMIGYGLYLLTTSLVRKFGIKQ